LEDLIDKHCTILLTKTPSGLCPECATEHDPQGPHNKLSLIYQYNFYDKHGRWPTWNDAMAHCSDEIRKSWKQWLIDNGIDVNDNEPKLTQRYKPEKQREVVCVSNEDNTYSCNDHASNYLKIGELYTVDRVEVDSCYTKVYLKEFPNKWFNSVAFEEV